MPGLLVNQVSFRGPGPRWLIPAGLIALVAAMAAYLFTRREELINFQRLSLTVLLLGLCLQCLSLLLWNGTVLLPLQISMKRLGFWELFMVQTGGFLAGYLVPVAGNMAVRMTYLRRRGLAYADFTWATLLSNIVVLSTGAALAVFAVGILWMMEGTPSASVLGLTAGVLALGVMGLTVFRFLPRLAGHPRLQRWSWLGGMSGFRASRRTVSWVAALSFTRHCCSFLTFGLLYQALSQAPGGFLTGGLVYAITSPVRMVVITPGNLGVNEWAVAIMGKALAFDVTTGLIVALVFRGLTLGAQGLGVLLAWACLGLWSKP
jgi:hypothetical protein